MRTRFILRVGSGVLAAALLPAAHAAAGEPPASVRADFAGHKASADARKVADWALATGDTRGAPFVIVDKKRARMHVFDGAGLLQGSAPVLLGLAKGDHTVPGIGDKPLEQIKPEERTTPAGRFAGEHGINAAGKDIIWVDYDAAVSLHRVLTTNAKERRLHRLATPTVADNRISFGCINVPTAFYDGVLLRTLGKANPVVYVLPETRSLEEAIGVSDVRMSAGARPSSARVPTAAAAR